MMTLLSHDDSTINTVLGIIVLATGFVLVGQNHANNNNNNNNNYYYGSFTYNLDSLVLQHCCSGDKKGTSV